MDTGRSASTNSELRHLSSEDLHRVAGASIKELAVRNECDEQEICDAFSSEFESQPEPRD